MWNIVCTGENEDIYHINQLQPLYHILYYKPLWTWAGGCRDGTSTVTVSSTTTHPTQHYYEQFKAYVVVVTMLQFQSKDWILSPSHIHLLLESGRWMMYLSTGFVMKCLGHPQKGLLWLLYSIGTLPPSEGILIMFWPCSHCLLYTSPSPRD